MAAIRLLVWESDPAQMAAVVWVGTTVLPGVLAAPLEWDLACPGGESWPGLARREWSGATGLRSEYGHLSELRLISRTPGLVKITGGPREEMVQVGGDKAFINKYSGA